MIVWAVLWGYVVWGDTPGPFTMVGVATTTFWHSLMGVDDSGEPITPLYLWLDARSREQVMKTVAEKGLNKSKIHVLAALTRLRQICCHPRLVGNDSISGKTETLFELLDSLIAACAIGLSADLCTFNLKHYQAVPGLTTTQPYSR